MSEQAIIAAVSRGVMATLADGTLRVKIDIEPGDAEQAFKLLGMPGNPIAIARLAVGTPTPQPEPAPEQPKGGPLAKLAGQWCDSPEFADWLADQYSDIFRDALEVKHGDISAACAVMVRGLCLVESRAMLDHDEQAGRLFHTRIRIPYMAHLEEINHA